MPLDSFYGPAPIIDKPFHELILDDVSLNSRKWPDEHALVDSESGEKYTFEDVYNLSHSLATWLHKNGLRKGDVVLICLPNCIQYPIISLGCWLRGGVISGVNWQFTEGEILTQMNDCECVMVFTTDSLLPKVLGAAKHLGNTIGNIVAIRTQSSETPPSNVVDFCEVIKTDPDFRPPRINFNTKQDLFLLPYSSGTTGPPKGVMVTHYNGASVAACCKKHFEEVLFPNIKDFDIEKEHYLANLPFFHIYAFSLVMYFLRIGITTITIPQFLPDKYLALVQQTKVLKNKIFALKLKKNIFPAKFLYGAPPLVVFLAKDPIVEKYNLTNVQYVFSGSAPLGRDLAEEIMKRHPNLKLLQGYGMTEGYSSHLPDPMVAPSGSAGRIMSNMLCKIVDVEETGSELGTNQLGEVWIKGPGIMKGYLKRPEATAQVVDKNGWLHTGDIGYNDENECISIVDRLKELIKVDGYQVPPAELEDLLLTHPYIQDAAVNGVPDMQSGELPQAYVVLKQGQHLSEIEVQQFVEEKVAPCKRLKGGVVLVNQIPRSPSGKILRRRLLRHWPWKIGTDLTA